MNQLQRLVDLVFDVYEVAIANRGSYPKLPSLWVETNDVDLVSQLTGQNLNLVTEYDPFFQEEIPIQDVETRSDHQGKQQLVRIFFDVVIDSHCLRIVSDVLSKEWKENVHPRRPTGLFPSFQQLFNRFANRTISDAIGDLNKMKASWKKAKQPKPSVRKNEKPTYGLVFNSKTNAVWIAWPEDRRRRTRQVDLPMDQQPFQVFLAILESASDGLVTNSQLALKLYHRGVVSIDDRVRGNIRRWVCEFNKICQAASGERSVRPLVGRKGQYEITINVMELPS